MAYTEPTVRDLVNRYPAFASVPTSTVETYLAETAEVDGGWAEGDYIAAKCALAAHRMALLGMGTRTEVETYAAAGVTRIKSGNFEAAFSDSRVAAASGGGLSATPYGLIYKGLLRRNRGGPRVIGAGLNMGVEGPGTWGY